MKNQEKAIENLISSLGITREEAIEIIAFDNEEYELEEVQEMTQKAKEVATPVKRGRKPQTKEEKATKMSGVTQQKRAKKENPTKSNIIKSLFEAIQQLEGVENATNPNPEKTILFELGGNTFEIDLKQKRKPKA